MTKLPVGNYVPSQGCQAGKEIIVKNLLEKAKEQIKVKVEQVVQTKSVAYESSPKTSIGNSESSKSKSERGTKAHEMPDSSSGEEI